MNRIKVDLCYDKILFYTNDKIHMWFLFYELTSGYANVPDGHSLSTYTNFGNRIKMNVTTYDSIKISN